MNTPPPITISPNPSVHIAQAVPWISWGSIIAGVVVAIAVQIGLTELCIGSGLSLYEPGDPVESATNVAVGTVIAWFVCGLVSVFIGGWIAGRMKRHGTLIEAAVHGALVWALGGILIALLATVSLGLLAGSAVSLLGQGLSAAARGADVVAQGVSAAVPSWESARQQVEGAFQRADAPGGAAPGSGDEAGATNGAANARDDRFSDRSRLMQLLGQFFNVDANAVLSQADHQELSTLLAGQLGISAQAAQRTLEQWQRVWRQGVERYQAAKEDAKQAAMKAVAVADRRTTQAAIIAFCLMLIGLVAAIGGALAGNACLWSRVRAEVGVGSQLGHPALG